MKMRFGTAIILQTTLLFTLLTHLAFSQIPTDGLVAYYAFESIANNSFGQPIIADGTGSGRDFKVGNNPQIVAGIKGNGLQLTGRTNNGYAGDHLYDWFTSQHFPFWNWPEFTISIWVNEYALLNPAGEAYIFWGNLSYGWLGIMHDANGISFAVGASEYYNYATPLTIPFSSGDQNVFVNYTLKYKNGTLYAYKNGELKGQKSQTVRMNGDGGENGAMGRHFWGNIAYINQNTSTRFSGILDEVRIYNRALSDDEVAELYEMEKPPIDLSSGLVAHYKFEGNTNDEKGQHDGSAYGNLTYENGVSGQAAKFDGIDDYITIPDNNNLQPKKITLSTWVFMEIENDTHGAILSKMDNDNNGYRILYNSNYGDPNSCFNNYWFDYGKHEYIYSDCSGQVNHPSIRSWSQTKSTIKKWTHIVGTYNGVNSKVFINGQLDNSFNNGFGDITYGNNFDLTIGKRNVGLPFFFKGKLDDIRIYNRVLSDDEVAELYEMEKPPIDLTTGLVAHYPFNGNANDESGNGNNGTVNGATLTEDRFGCPNKAYSFDGNDYIDIPNSSSLQSIITNNKLTISSWIYVRNWDQGWFSVLDRYNYGTDWGWLYQLNSQALIIELISGGGCTASYSTLVNKWYHLAVTFDGNAKTVRHYVNGSLIDECINSELNLDPSEENVTFYFGHNPSGGDEFNDGIQDNIRIYNRALSEAEIQELYNQGSDCQEAPLPEDLVLWLDGQDVGAKFEVPPTPPESFFDVWFDQTTPQENAEQSDLNRQAFFTVANGFGNSRPGVLFTHASGAGGHGWGNDDVMEILFSPEISSGVENELLMSDPAATFTSKNLLVVFKTPEADAMYGRQLLFETGETTSGFNMYLDDGTLLFGMWNRLERKFLRYKPEQAVPLASETVYLLHLEFDAEKKQFRGILSGDASSPLGFSGITKDPDDTEGKASTGICGEVLGTRFHDFNIRTDNYAYTCSGIFGDILLYNKAFSKSEMDDVYSFLNGRYGQGWIYPDWPISGEKAPSRWIAYEENLSEPIEPAIATFKPNPFSNVTVMTLNVPSEQNVVIELFDALGRLVQTVYSGEAVAGSMELRIDGTSLPNGVYTVKARGESFHIAANIVVIK